MNLLRRFTQATRKSKCLMSTNNIIPVSEVTRFNVDCMRAVNVPLEHAQMLSDVLVAADYRGHYSHGLNRLEMYVRDVSTSICDGSATPIILKRTAATALVDGRNALGPVVGNFCMHLAIKKALETGVGWVTARGSNHYGIASWYSLQAVEKGMIGLSFTNTSPLMSPTRAKKPALGTNPLTLAAPGKNGDSFVLDMATTAVALGKLEVKRRKGEELPLGWAQDELGVETTDATRAVTKGTLLPLGGTELTSGYKGYGLAFLVELLCGLMADASYGPNIRRWMTTDREANLGQCFIALNPDAFAPGFTERLQDLMDFLRQMEPKRKIKPLGLEYVHAKRKEIGKTQQDLTTGEQVQWRGEILKAQLRNKNFLFLNCAFKISPRHGTCSPVSDASQPVMVAGDPERKKMAANDKQGGIEYHENQIKSCLSLAEELKVLPMQPTKS